jgi:HKD family nuclease
MHTFFLDPQPSSARIFGAPESFQLDEWILKARTLKIALAFGHMSGWRQIEDAIRRSSASTVNILLGQSFLQTEPELLFALKKLSTTQSSLKAKLAASATTFHPKVWIANGSDAIVGSSNLSKGGFGGNVECNVYLEQDSVVKAIDEWFDHQWDFGHDLDSPFFNSYIEQYQKIEIQRRAFRSKLELAHSELHLKESKWRQKTALTKTLEYWKGGKGRSDVQDRERAIADMRRSLKFPDFTFDSSGYEEFLGNYELGHIVPIHKHRTISALPQLRAALQNVGRISVVDSYDELDRIDGVGRNIATKLLAICNPEQFIVVNEPIERALMSFGFSPDNFENMGGTKYQIFLEKLEPFIEEALIANLTPAAALDAFFYYYRG